MSKEQYPKPDIFEATHESVETSGASDITERQRQIDAERYITTHDDEHVRGELVLAALAYIDDESWGEVPNSTPPDVWPWHRDYWNPKDRRTNLVRAGALLAAEVDRLDRDGRQPVSNTFGPDIHVLKGLVE